MTRCARVAMLAVVTAALASAVVRAQSTALGDDPAVAPSPEALRIAAAIPDEDTPEPGEHYPTSNEWRHDLWFPHLRDLGGAFVGVGSDQCYTLAAIQDARVAWLVDFDPMVPAVHRMHGVLIGESASPEAFLARFEPARLDETRALLEARLEGDPLRARALRIFDFNRDRWHRYFSRVARLRRDGVPASWLADPALYARVRALFASGRVIARNGDLTGTRTVAAIGAAARALGVPVRVLYTSNAEEFFPYGPSFVANVRALPSDERSIVLRTFRDPAATYPPGDRWHYVVHAWPDFADRLESGHYHRGSHIVADLLTGRRPAQGPHGLTIIDARTQRRRGPR